MHFSYIIGALHYTSIPLLCSKCCNTELLLRAVVDGYIVNINIAFLDDSVFFCERSLITKLILVVLFTIFLALLFLYKSTQWYDELFV